MQQLVFLYVLCVSLHVNVFLVLHLNVEDNKISCVGGMRTGLLVFHQPEQLKRLPPHAPPEKIFCGLALNQFDALCYETQSRNKHQPRIK